LASHGRKAAERRMATASWVLSVLSTWLWDGMRSIYIEQRRQTCQYWLIDQIDDHGVLKSIVIKQQLVFGGEHFSWHGGDLRANPSGQSIMRTLTVLK